MSVTEYLFPTNASFHQMTLYLSFYLLMALSTIWAGDQLSRTMACAHLPETSVLMTGGWITTTLLSRPLAFSSVIFNIFFLPPLICKTGLELSLPAFSYHYLTIMFYANVGTLWNILCCGVGLWIVGLIPHFSMKITILEGVLIGSILSATDPVTTVSVFERLRVDQMLSVIVIAVSVLDDAVSVIAYELTQDIISDGVDDDDGDTTSFDVAEVAGLLGRYLSKVIGSTGCGILLGYIWVWLMMKTSPFTASGTSSGANATTYQVVSFFLVIYLSYAVGEALELSGIITALYLGLTVQYYYRRLASTRHLLLPPLDKLKEALAAWCQPLESLLFFYMGMSFLAAFPPQTISSFSFSYRGSAVEAYVLFPFWAVVICLVARAIQIYPLAFLLNAYHRQFHPLETAQRSKNRGRGGGVGIEMLDSTHPKQDAEESKKAKEEGSDVLGKSNLSPPAALSSPSSITSPVSAYRYSTVGVDEDIHEDESVHGDKEERKTDEEEGSGSVSQRRGRRKRIEWESVHRGTGEKQISMAQQHMLLLAGLRGPIALATSSTFFSSSSDNVAHPFLFATVVTIYLTTMIFGAATIPALRFLQVFHSIDGHSHSGVIQDQGGQGLDYDGGDFVVEREIISSNSWLGKADNLMLEALLSSTATASCSACASCNACCCSYSVSVSVSANVSIPSNVSSTDSSKVSSGSLQRGGSSPIVYSTLHLDDQQVQDSELSLSKI